MTNSPYKSPKSGKILLGIIFILLGCVFMLDKLDVHFPHWVISWPSFLIVLGAYLGYRNQFRKPMPVILMVIGCFFLADDILPQLNFSDFVWPVILICLGGFMIMGRNRRGWKEQWQQAAHEFKWDAPAGSGTDTAAGQAPPVDPYTGMSSEDYIDSVAIFGSTKKTITSKNFRGGEIVNIMGGAEINLTQADFAGKIVLDVTQVFGGTKIIVPPHWQIHSETAAIFGGVEDKRPVLPGTINHDKELVIKGTSIFGGIDIRSF